MATYLVTPTDRRLPPFRVTAANVIELGEKAAAYFARHKRLTRGVPYDAEVGSDRGALYQAGMHTPVTFTITQEQS